jgi:hypothetical protein
MSRPGKKQMLPYEWHVLYRAALLETNLLSLRGKVDAAESALHQRELELKTAKKATRNTERSRTPFVQCVRYGFG